VINIDLVTVFHNETNYAQHRQLARQLALHEPDGGYRIIAVDNRTTNRGFARGCNLGALHPDAHAAVIGFLNPDAEIDGSFIATVLATIDGTTVITGARFAKPDSELRAWGVRDWVCGAAMFVQRRWFESVDGFDEQFVWSWEETDLIRQAERHGLTCRSIPLPIRHHSPNVDTPADARYKHANFNQGAQRFYRKWGR
jgi:GT2 family glycosyltransferase